MLSAQLIAPAIENTLSSGYDWILETLRASPHAEVACELEISKALQFLKQKDFEKVRTLNVAPFIESFFSQSKR